MGMSPGLRSFSSNPRGGKEVEDGFDKVRFSQVCFFHCRTHFVLRLNDSNVVGLR